MVSGGCIISGALVRNSLLFSNVRVEEHTTIESTVVLPDVIIGKNCDINHAIIDRGCEIPDGMIVGKNNEEDSKRFFVSPKGVVLITPEMLGQQIHQVK